jgi:hypothetical protein
VEEIKMFKKFMVTIGFIGFFTIIGIAQTLEHSYTMNGYVYDSNTIIDERGEEWNYDTELTNGLNVIITFHDNTTINYIYDDVITAVVTA